MFKGFLGEFKKFAMRGNVIDMAVGIIIGAAFGKIVDSMVKDVIMPPIGLLLGLTCDPIGGLVEVPCVKRNVIGAVNAVTAADMVLAGVSSVIPADEVIDVMGEIGNDMPKKYKETAEGGLAMTPTAVEITKNLPH